MRTRTTTAPLSCALDILSIPRALSMTEQRPLVGVWPGLVAIMLQVNESKGSSVADHDECNATSGLHPTCRGAGAGAGAGVTEPKDGRHDRLAVFPCRYSCLLPNVSVPASLRRICVHCLDHPAAVTVRTVCLSTQLDDDYNNNSPSSCPLHSPFSPLVRRSQPRG